MSKSSTQRIPKYQHFKPRNLAKVRLDGRDIYLGRYDSPESHRQYKKVIAEWLVQKIDLPDKLNRDITLCELLAAFLRHASTYYVKDGKQTREFGCIKEALSFVRELYEMTLVDEFGPLCLQAVREAMVAKHWSRKYINKQISRIRRMFRWGVSKELVSSETYQALTTVADLRKGRTEAVDYEPVTPVPPDVVEETLNELSPVVADMVRFHQLTGCRPTEVCLLRPGAVKRDQQVWVFEPDSHKTEHQDRNRVVFIGPKAQRIIERYMDRPAHAYCFDPREAPKARKNAKERYTKDSYGRAIRRAVDRINGRRTKENGEDAELLEAWSPNRLRHFAATEIRKQFGLEAAQVILGHSKADVTQVYAERDYELGIDIARQYG